MASGTWQLAVWGLLLKQNRQKLISAVTLAVCGSLTAKCLPQLSLETDNSRIRHYRIIMRWGEHCGFTRRHHDHQEGLLQIECGASCQTSPPSHVHLTLSVRPGMGLDLSRFLCVSLAFGQLWYQHDCVTRNETCADQRHSPP